MKKWVVCYDYGPHMATEVIVEARYADTARKRGIAAAKARGHHPLINWVKLEETVEMNQRKQVTETLNDYVSLYDILDCNTPDEVIQVMEVYKQEYQGRKISFSVQSYGYDGGTDVVILETRLETDQECAKRIKAEQKEEERVKAAKAKSVEKERKEYERLKKKFERS